MGADFVDLNFGCPVPKIVNKGAGSAVLKDLKRLQKILRTVKSSVQIPVTIKIRTGWTETSRNGCEVTQIAFDEGITWVAIHGRTRAARYSGLADWDYIKKVATQSPLPVLGNGDITTPQMAQKRLNESGCKGVMIGRGCLKNPWIFLESLKLFKKSQLNKLNKTPCSLNLSGKTPHLNVTNIGSSDIQQKSKTPVTTIQKPTTPYQKDFLWLFEKLYNHLEMHCEEKIILLQMKKFSAWYSSGYPDSSLFRKNIFQIKEITPLKECIFSYFEKVSAMPTPQPDNKPFLMGGHG